MPGGECLFGIRYHRSVHSAQKSTKMCNFGKLQCLPQRLKSVFFKLFSNGAAPKSEVASGVNKKNLLLAFYTTLFFHF